MRKKEKERILKEVRELLDSCGKVKFKIERGIHTYWIDDFPHIEPSGFRKITIEGES